MKQGNAHGDKEKYDHGCGQQEHADKVDRRGGECSKEDDDKDRDTPSFQNRFASDDANEVKHHEHNRHHETYADREQQFERKVDVCACAQEECVFAGLKT